MKRKNCRIVVATVSNAGYRLLEMLSAPDTPDAYLTRTINFTMAGVADMYIRGGLGDDIEKKKLALAFLQDELEHGKAGLTAQASITAVPITEAGSVKQS